MNKIENIQWEFEYEKHSVLPSLIFSSDWPIYIFNSSGPLTDKKHKLHSVATALANKVLPVPGGPNNSIPRRI